ncbi:peptidylprolyl isomerase [Sphingomonas jeddahensis]|uniref:peptidylprolyl isomerase n=1 Tax=Sphingomonas jeddahensis TaxID=1915074 RepID=A0A1V2EV15_9SPHN|nr:peptidylprolyl isomerase [Sphingomonas jeddahensis]ONF96393.1 Peptidyl-prolyl cis-trans isomerase cyp18 [Sphingomonas jeddahensis]
MRMLLATAALIVSTPLVAQEVPTPTPAPAPTPAPDPATTTRVTINTAAGPIVLAIETQKAPVTSANFLKYVDGKRLDGTVFYRTVKVQAEPRYGFIQFGTQNDPKRTLPAIAHEPTSKTGLSHVDGAISMAMAEPGSARGDFFIIVGNTPAMDATPTTPGYAVFGRVVEGMDVVHRIMDMPTSPTKGEGIMKGQMLEPTLPVKSARRTPAAAVTSAPQ